MNATWPELNFTGPGLFDTGLKSSGAGQEYLLLQNLRLEQLLP
jgi:hypothetical protein